MIMRQEQVSGADGAFPAWLRFRVLRSSLIPAGMAIYCLTIWLSISPTDIDTLVLSHQHWDHIGGLPAILHANPYMHIYVPSSFSANLKKEVSSRCAALHEVKGPQSICGDVYTTGELGTDIKEQSWCSTPVRGYMSLQAVHTPGFPPF